MEKKHRLRTSVNGRYAEAVQWTAEEIAERRPVWIALSGLFLDTDVRLEYIYIAEVVARSRLSLAEAREILLKEVAPAAGVNLLEIAGDWAGFDEEWLVGRILQGGTTWWIPLAGIREHWVAVAFLAERLRSLPEEERERRAIAWREMLTLFLHQSPRPAPRLFECGYSGAELESIFQKEAREAFGAGIRAYKEHNPKLYPTEDEILTQWKTWVTPDR